MASTVHLKRRLSGSGHADSRSDFSCVSQPGVTKAMQCSVTDPSTPPSTTSKAGQRQKYHKEQLQASDSQLSSVQPIDFKMQGEVSSAPSNAKVTAEAKQGSWNLLRTLKLLGSDEVEDSVPSFNLKGFGALGVVRRAADGLASTATTMATSLDEAVEQLFVGWTPAPPASDHTSYGTSPTASLPHHNYKPSAHSKKPTLANTVQSSVKPQDAEAAAGQSQTSLLKTDQGANEGWGEWESPFNSGSTSPDTCSQGPAAATPGLVGIAAWRAKPSGHDQAGLAAPPQQQHAKINHAADSFLRSRDGPDSAQASTSDGVSDSRHDSEAAYRDQLNCSASAQALHDARQQLQTAVESAESGRERVLQLQGKLQEAKVSPDTLDRLRHEISGALEEVATASQQCSLLSHHHQGVLQHHQATLPDPDPLADQVAGQLQALLTEKAHLAQENARLARENTGLQELLQYAMHQHPRESEPMQAESGDDFGDWASLDNALPDGAALPSSENGSPQKPFSSSRKSSPAKVL